MKNSSIFLLFAMTISVFAAQEIPGVDQTDIILLVRHQGEQISDPDLARKIRYTEEAVQKVLAAHTITITQQYTVDDMSTESVRAQCQAQLVRWAVLVETEFKNEHLFWSFSVYDANGDFIRAQDALSIFFYIGAYAQDSMDLSAQKLVDKWLGSFTDQEHFDGRFAVQQQQHFIAKQEGVEVFWGNGQQGKSAGKTRQGYLIAPLFLFTQGEPVYGTAAKDGYWPQHFVLPTGISEESVQLPVLQKKTQHSFGFMAGFRSLGRTSVDFEYRFHILPDRLFLKADWSLWQDITAMSPITEALHMELRAGAGLYLLPWNDFPFRVFAGIGISFVFAGEQFRILGDPLVIGAEYHFSQWAAVAECRIPHLLDYSQGAFGYDALNDDIYLSVGIQLKW
jgi:hypothetical protein